MTPLETALGLIWTLFVLFVIVLAFNRGLAAWLGRELGRTVAMVMHIGRSRRA
jgi:hypothetical protein